MSLTLASLKTALTAKGGYTITPQARMLKDLKDLIENQKGLREQPGTVCTGHSDFTPDGMSLGDVNELVADVMPLKCSCQSQVSACTALGYSCGCHNRAACACNTQGCSCDTVCSCNTEANTCVCNTDSGGCSCDYDSNCSCDGDIYTNCPSNLGCGCEGDNGGCGSEYESNQSCGCNAESACTALAYACTCDSRAASCPCNSYYGA